MPLLRHNVTFETLPETVIARWREIPPAIVSDIMNRDQAMAARIKPVKPGTRLAGQARTATCMAGDNSAAHAAVPLLRKGEVLVLNAGGFPDVAIWGGILSHAAKLRGCGGIVIDGGVRDVAEIAEMDFPCYAAGHVPKGPHKGFGGTIDAVITCGGATVAPGDIIVGDDDGIAVVPLARQAELLEKSLKKIADEAATIARLEKGETTFGMMGLPEPELIP